MLNGKASLQTKDVAGSNDNGTHFPGREVIDRETLPAEGKNAKNGAVPTRSDRQHGQDSYYVSEGVPVYSTYASRRSQFTDAGYQERSASPEWDKVLEIMASETKTRHYSRKTLKTYALWSRNFQRFLKDKPPQELTSEDVKEYLSFLAVKSRVAASTQNQAVCRLKTED